MLGKWTKRWLIVLIGLPAAAWLLDQVADLLAQRRGQSDLTRGLHGVAERLRRVRRRR